VRGFIFSTAKTAIKGIFVGARVREAGRERAWKKEKEISRLKLTAEEKTPR